MWASHGSIWQWENACDSVDSLKRSSIALLDPHGPSLRDRPHRGGGGELSRNHP